jgi:hypothetical protein
LPASLQWRAVADQIRPKVPKLAAIMDEAEPDVLSYMTFPKEKDRTDEAVMASSLGKMPTTSVRRLISPLSRSIGLVECSLERCYCSCSEVGGLFKFVTSAT